MEWPPDLNDRVVSLAVTEEARQMAEEMRHSFQPRRSGSTSNPFFAHNDSVPVRPVEKRRASSVPLPWILTPLYEAYADDVEFFHPETCVTFLSETEILSRMREGDGIVDFAYRYAGMGHVMVFTYDDQTGAVLRGLDGGSNGHDREANHRERLRAWKEWKASPGTWPEEGAWCAKYASFTQFWVKEMKEGERML